MKVYEVNATLYGESGQVTLAYEARAMAGSGEEAIELAKSDSKGFWESQDIVDNKRERFDFILNSVKSITDVDLWPGVA